MDTRDDRHAAYDVALGPEQRVFSIFDRHAWYTTDEGDSWRPVDNSFLPGLDTLSASADGLGLFMAAGPNLYRYDVVANRVVTATSGLPIDDIKQIAVSPHFGTDQTIWVGALDGVWISHDAGASFVRAQGYTTFPLRSVAAAGASGPPATSLRQAMKGFGGCGAVSGSRSTGKC